MSHRLDRVDVNSAARSGGLLLGAAVGLAAALTFVFHATAGRALDQQDYSSLGALLALLVACAVPLGAVQAAVTAQTTRQLDTHSRVDGCDVLRRTTVAAVAAAMAVCALSPLLAQLLRLERSTPILIAAWWLAGNAPAAVSRGLLIGAGRLRAVAVSLSGGAMARLGLLAVMAPRFGLIGALAASVCGEVVGLTLARAACRRAGLLERGAPAVTAKAADAGRALRSQLVLWMFAGAAPVLARRALPPDEVGAFAAMATAASACLFLPQAIATCALPRFVLHGSLRQLRTTLLATGGVALLTATPLCLAPGLTFGVLFGSGYRAETAVLALLVLHMAGLGLLGTLAQFSVARRRGGATAPLAGLVLVAVGAEAAAGSALGLAGLLAAVTVPVVAVTAIQAQRWAALPGDSDRPSTRPLRTSVTVHDRGGPQPGFRCGLRPARRLGGTYRASAVALRSGPA